MFVGPAFNLSYVMGHAKAQKNLHQTIHLARLGILRLWIMDCSEMEVVKRFTRNNNRCTEKHMDHIIVNHTPWDTTTCTKKHNPRHGIQPREEDQLILVLKGFHTCQMHDDW
eukprot:1028935_1